MPTYLQKLEADANALDRPEAASILGQALLDDWLAQLTSPLTRKAYTRWIATLAAWRELPLDLVPVILFGHGPGPANALVLAFRAELLSRELAVNSVAQAIAAVRSLVRFARLVGLVTWELVASGPRCETYRDTRGPGLEGWQQLFAYASSRPAGAKRERDLAILRLLHDHALRLDEVLSLDLIHFEPTNKRIWIKAKKKAERVAITLAPKVLAQLRQWIAARGDHPGPLFPGLARRRTARLSNRGGHKLIADLGRAAGLDRPLWPHALRHAGITEAAKICGGNLLEVRSFSRHSDVRTVLRYVDDVADDHGRIARLVAENDGAE